MMILFVLLLIAVVAYAAGWRPQFLEWIQPGRSAGGNANSAQEILRERYARGEITRAEYQQIRQDIQG